MDTDKPVSSLANYLTPNMGVVLTSEANHSCRVF
jgi:hypothetical protein